MRRPIVAGNWKMHKSIAEATELTRGVVAGVGRMRGIEVVLCPPFTVLSTVGRLVKRRRIGIGAQDCHWEASGAFTGEISVGMIRDAGAGYCLVGHSERRALFGETNATVAKKTTALLAHGLIPITCVGETLAERQAGRTLAVLEDQLRVGLSSVPAAQATQLVVAYEPVWAIGTGQNATPAQAQEAHAFIRQLLGRLFSTAAAQAIRIQYGGSVKPENSAELIQQPDIDGFLVGGASLNAASFVAIAHAAAARPTSKESLCTP